MINEGGVLGFVHFGGRFLTSALAPSKPQNAAIKEASLLCLEN
jgi:hypothetical protein